MRINKTNIGLLFLLFSVGCATSSTNQNPAPDALTTNDQLEAATEAEEYPGLSEEAEKILAEALLDADHQIEEQDRAKIAALEAPTSSSPKPRVPIVINEKVRKWIHFFTVKDRERFARFLERGEYYKDYVESVLKAYELPKELYYLAMIESGYQSHAYSRARAVGVWQFMQHTGRQYGLSANAYVDERRDPQQATKAAARHLRDLHEKFQSWYLAMAAYNAGEGRINGAIRRGGTRDFWKLVERRVLPRETIEYVPKFLAAVIVGKNREKFGFHIRQNQKQPALVQARVPASVSLKQVAALSGTSYDEFKTNNPHYRKDVTPPYGKAHFVWVESGASAKKLQKNIHALKKVRVASAPRQKLAAHKVKKYRVRKGENLYQISRKFNVSVMKIKKANGMKGSTLLAGEVIRVPVSL